MSGLGKIRIMCIGIICIGRDQDYAYRIICLGRDRDFPICPV